MVVNTVYNYIEKTVCMNYKTDYLWKGNTCYILKIDIDSDLRAHLLKGPLGCRMMI